MRRAAEKKVEESPKQNAPKMSSQDSINDFEEKDMIIPSKELDEFK